MPLMYLNEYTCCLYLFKFQIILFKLLKWLHQPSTTSGNKISPVCLLINEGEKRHKLAGLMGLILPKCHMSDSGEMKLVGEQRVVREKGFDQITKGLFVNSAYVL